jgi:hypothetical protein
LFRTWLASELNDLGSQLIRGGKRALADLIFAEGSKLHVFVSPLQRPLDNVADLETKAVWPLDHVRLTTHEEELAKITQQWKKIKEEALQLK